jgi:uncharacterized protein YjbI with pentapeptide repeats
VKGWPKRIDNWVYQHRVLSLLLAVMFTLVLVALANWISGSDLFRQFFFPKICDKKLSAACDPLEWKDLFQAAILVLGLPVAFLLWHWRDTNVRDQIAEQRNQVEEQAKQVENSRKDINLKEFQEVQLRAAGALDESLPEEAREQLQIAALHQLRGFLRGEYGESFKRPAFELLLSGHAAATNRIGVPNVRMQISGQSRDKIVEAVTALRGQLSPIDNTRKQIIRDEAEHIFRSYFPLDGRSFDLLDLRKFRFPSNLDLGESHFFGAELTEASFEGSQLIMTCFDGANMRFARFHGANLVSASFQGSDLYAAHLEKTNLKFAILDSADLWLANMEGADARGVSVNAMTRLTRVRFNNHTQFGEADFGLFWDDLSEIEKESARARWLAYGAMNIDAPQVDTEDDE